VTVNHVFYIPLILAAGGLIGYFLARRHMRQKLAQEERERRILAERKAAREAKRQEKSAEPITAD
jgi:hypothetical protein